MTLEAWVNPTNNAGWRTAILKERAGRPVLRAVLGRRDDAAGDDHHRRDGGYGEAGGPARLGAAGQHVDAPRRHLRRHDAAAVPQRHADRVRRRAPAPSRSAPAPLKLGGNAIWGEWFAGQLDDVRVYDAALTAAQIQTDMNTPVGGAPAPDTTRAVGAGRPSTATGALGSVRAAAGRAATDNVGVDRLRRAPLDHRRVHAQRGEPDRDAPTDDDATPTRRSPRAPTTTA